MSTDNTRIIPPTKMTDRIRTLRERFFEHKANLDIERAVFMEEMYASGQLDDMPAVLRVAKLMDNYLEKRTIYIEDDQLLAGSFGRKPKAMPLYPEASGTSMIPEYRKARERQIDPFDISDEDLETLEQVLYKMEHLPSLRINFYDSLSDEEKKYFLRNPEKSYTELTQLCSMDPVINGPGGHITPDFETVIELGYGGLTEKAEARLRQAVAEKDQEAIDFLNATIISMQSMIKLAHRYAALAEEKAEKEANPQRKRELLQIAENCYHVPEHPARNFHEACQTTWFAFMGIQMEACQRCFSVGRFDQMANHLLMEDLDSGQLTEMEAQEILDCFMLKFSETNSFNSESFSQTVAGFAPQQQVVVGGQTPEGKNAVNKLSYLVLQSAINLRLAQPSYSVRFFKNTPTKFIEMAASLARLGTGHPSFFNDEVVVPSLRDKGIILRDARDYAVAGCSSVQVTRKDKGSHNGGYLNLASSVDLALNNGYWRHGDKQIGPKTGNPRDFKTYEEFEAAVKAQFADFIRVHASASAKCERIHREISPTPFISSFIQDCITRGKDRTNGGAFYNDGFSPRAIGMADVADSLSIIRKVVFEDKLLTMDEVVDAVNANFEGYEETQDTLAHGAPRYGVDDDYADDLAYEITNFYAEETKKHKALFGGVFHPGFSTVSANVPYGRVVYALPTGRKAWTPLADGISPCHHIDSEGPTAMVLSSCKVDHVGMSGGSILNVKFDPGAVVGDEGLTNLTAFIKGAMDAGVWHMQFNINNVEMLEDAQKRPEEFADLLVRVAGYSALFTAISTQLQDDIIDRTVHYI